MVSVINIIRIKKTLSIKKNSRIFLLVFWLRLLALIVLKLPVNNTKTSENIDKNTHEKLKKNELILPLKIFLKYKIRPWIIFYISYTLILTLLVGILFSRFFFKFLLFLWEILNFLGWKLIVIYFFCIYCSYILKNKILDLNFIITSGIFIIWTNF